MMWSHVYILILLLVATATCSSAFGQDSSLDDRRGVASTDYIRFYQQHISEHKNSICPMYPSCSAYGMMVFKDKPFYEAISLCADRLFRCSHERQYYDVIYVNGHKRYVDYPYYKGIPLHLVYNSKPLPHTDMLKKRVGRDDSKLFIEYLINKEDYQAALLEIERLLFVQQLEESYLYSYKLLCYRGLKEYEKGICEYEISFPAFVKNNTLVQMQLALLYYSVGNMEGTLKSIEPILSTSTDSVCLSKAYTLKGLVQLKEYNWDSGKESLISASCLQDNPVNVVHSIRLLEQMKTQKKKKPVIAKILSLIPGAGYLYANHKGSALVSFFMNSLLAYSTYTSIKSKNYGVAGLCGFLSLSFYIGNINGAGRSAVRYNERVNNAKIREIENLNNIFIN